MAMHSIPGSDGTEQPDLPALLRGCAWAGHSESDYPDAGPSSPEAAPASVLDLVNRTFADATRTANATTIVTTVSKGAARIVLSMGIVLVAIVVLAGTLSHFAGLGPVLDGAIAVGGTTAAAGGRYLWNRRAAKRRSDAGR